MKKKPGEKILAEVQKKAFQYEKNYYGCSRCVARAVVKNAARWVAELLLEEK